MTIPLAREVQIALLIIEKVVIPAKYLNYIDVISENLVVELSEYSNINKNAIDLESEK